MKRTFQRTMLVVTSLLLTGLTVFTARAAEPQTYQLWSDKAPGAVGDADADKPSLTLYPAPADKRTGSAIVICPGGGYAHLAVDHEGRQIAEWLNSQGVTALVLRYRLSPRYHHPAPLTDVQRAIRVAKFKAGDWGYEAGRVGIIGFSAGGHLASTAGTHFDQGNPDADDPIDRTSCRPDVMILGYPVISMSNEFTHIGSRNNLLGDKPTAELETLMSSELQVKPDSPPTFLVHSTADTGVLPQNSTLMYNALRKAGVAAELHIFEEGPHGFGLAEKYPTASLWPKMCAAFLGRHGFLK